MKKEIKMYHIDPIQINNLMEEIIDYILGDEPNTFTMEMAVAFEEAYVNVANHAYKNESGPIFIEITKEPNKIKIILKDEGISYDPTKKEIKEMTDEFQIGGHGLRIMKNNSQVRYKRKDKYNILTLIKTKEKGEK